MEAANKLLRRKDVSEPRVMQFTLDRDMNVPETLGDISEIVDATGNITVEEERLVGDKIYLKGFLGYQVLYVSEDEEQGLAGLEGKIGFDEVLRIDNTLEGIWRSKVTTEDVSVSIIHPRKISITSLVTLSAVCVGESEQSVIGSPENREDMECLFEEKTLHTLVYSGVDRITLKEQIGIMSGYPNIAQILYYSCRMKDYQLNPGADCYDFVGRLELFIVYRAEDSDQPYALWEQELAFEKEVEAMDIDSGCLCFAVPELSRVNLELAYDEDGEPRLVNVSAEISCDMEAYRESQETLLMDAYSANGELVCERQEFSLPAELMLHGGNMKLNETIVLPEGTDDVGELLHSTAELRDCEISCDEEGVHVAGALAVVCYYRTTDERVPLRAMKQSFDFVEHMPVGAGMTADGPVRSSVCGSVEHISVKAAAQGEYEVKASVNLNLMRLVMRKGEFISDVRMNAEYERRRKQIVCYYVREGDTIFSIGRKYGVKQDDIMKWNTDISLKQGARIYMYTPAEQ